MNEYISLDVELGFIHDFHEVMQLETDVLRYMFQQVAKIVKRTTTITNRSTCYYRNTENYIVTSTRNLKSKYRKESPVGI